MEDQFLIAIHVLYFPMFEILIHLNNVIYDYWNRYQKCITVSFPKHPVYLNMLKNLVVPTQDLQSRVMFIFIDYIFCAGFQNWLQY